MHTLFCSLDNISKEQLGAQAHTWEQCFIHGQTVDLCK